MRRGTVIFAGNGRWREVFTWYISRSLKDLQDQLLHFFPFFFLIEIIHSLALPFEFHWTRVVLKKYSISNTDLFYSHFEEQDNPNKQTKEMKLSC